MTITTTRTPATDLGFLLHKHPDRVQRFSVPGGDGFVFYPEAQEDRTTAALLVEVDPIGLVRRSRRGGATGPLAQYVNDRPYAAGSMLAAAMNSVFRTAMRGECQARPELTSTPIPLEVHLPSLPSSGGAALVNELFAPLGWSVSCSPIALDETVPEWGDSPYLDVKLSGSMPLADALSHLYVLLPVLDGAKHYWVGTDEVDKLVRAGSGWLPTHPRNELISRRYLAHDKTLVADALERFAELDQVAAAELNPAVPDVPENKEPPLRVVRREAVSAALHETGARTVVDMGCGQGELLRGLLADQQFTKIVGVDVSATALAIAQRRLHLNRRSEREQQRIDLLQSSITYRDTRLAGFEAMVLMEVVEHVDPDRLPALEKVVFQHARPSYVVVTTPNREYNRHYEGLAAGQLRHVDHRFEWSRAEFGSWCEQIMQQFGYQYQTRPVGPVDDRDGAPTQMAVFSRSEPGAGVAHD